MNAFAPFFMRFLLLMALCTHSAWAWFGPSAEKPYALTVPALAPTLALMPTWTWHDARPTLELENKPTRDGYAFGDAVFKLRPAEYLQAEFLYQVATHEERAALLEKLEGKTVRLLEFNAGVGLWLRLGERQSGKWESVRVRAVMEVDGSRYEASDTHPFRSGEQPSPVSIPMREMVRNLVNQILLF